MYGVLPREFIFVIRPSADIPGGYSLILLSKICILLRELDNNCCLQLLFSHPFVTTLCFVKNEIKPLVNRTLDLILLI